MVNSRVPPSAATSAHACLSQVSSAARPTNKPTGRVQLRRERRWGRRTVRRGQRRILAEHLLFQTAQLDAGIRADLIGQENPDLPQGGERIRLTTALVQGGDQLYPETFVQRMLGAQCLSFSHHLRGPTERESDHEP